MLNGLAMSPDLAYWLTFVLKVLLSAAFVVTVSFIIERAGPVIGSLFSTLPVSTGPAYVLIALDHDAAFIAATAVVSLALHPASMYYALLYSALARRYGMAVSIGAGLTLWFAIALALHQVPWTLMGAVAVNIVTFVVCEPLAKRFMGEKMPPVVRRWYDVPLRAALVSTVSASVLLLSGVAGPGLTGVIAVFPAVFTSLILVLHPRLGGRPTAAVITNGTYGLMGFGVGLVALILVAESFGKWAALLSGLAVAAMWNLGLWALWRSSLAGRLLTALRRSS